MRVCMCVHCSHRQTHGSLRSSEYYRGVDHRGTRPLANRQAPLINPLHTDAFSPLSLFVTLSFSPLLPLCVSLFFCHFPALHVSVSSAGKKNFTLMKTIPLSGLSCSSFLVYIHMCIDSQSLGGTRCGITKSPFLLPTV